MNERWGQMIDHNGRLAQYRGYRTLADRPATEALIVVSDLPAEQFEHILGQVTDRNGYIRIGTRDIKVEADDWRPVRVISPVPKPRDGARYTWYWTGESAITEPRWEKKWYPLCPDCNRQHAEGKCKA